MDPEDIFQDVSGAGIPELSEHFDLNKAFLEGLKESNISYRCPIVSFLMLPLSLFLAHCFCRYSRLSLLDRVEESELSVTTAGLRNSEMGKFQRVRLQSVVEDGDVSVGESMSAEEE